MVYGRNVMVHLVLMECYTWNHKHDLGNASCYRLKRWSLGLHRFGLGLLIRLQRGHMDVNMDALGRCRCR